ncbi:MAG: NADP-specific glutamate dehydrogenase, partial [Methylocystaceae bacterium]
MTAAKSYVEKVIAKVKKMDGTQPEFLQTVEEVLPTLEPVMEKHPEYIKANLLERMVEPERQIA